MSSTRRTTDSAAERSPPSGPPFPSQQAAERAAVVGFALGSVALTGSLGLRTALFHPEYEASSGQLRVLGAQAGAELVVALFMGWISLRPGLNGQAKTLFAILAVVLTSAKIFVALGAMATADIAGPWAVSFATWISCALVSLPLALSFLPVIAAVQRARRVRAHDGPIEVRATLVVWLLSVGLATAVLGPGAAVRAGGLVAMGAAALQWWLGSIEMERLSGWLRCVLAEKLPAYLLEHRAPLAEVPPVFDGADRVATIFRVGDDPGAYRRDPGRAAVAAVDPAKDGRPRPFHRRVVPMLGVPLGCTLVATVLCLVLLSPADLPPRELASAFEHNRVWPERAYSMPGLTLWRVERDDGSGRVVGWDPAAKRRVEGEVVFAGLRGLSPLSLAYRANEMIYDGYCCVLSGDLSNEPLARDGSRPRPPYVEGGKLLYWRKTESKVYRHEVAVTDEMWSH